MNIGIQFFIAAAFVVGSAVEAAGQSKTCHGADGESAHVISAVNALMKPESASIRTRFGVPFASASQITLVTDSAVCARAGQALDSLARAWAPNQPQPPADSDPLYVVQLGSDFAVVDGTTAPTEHYKLVFYFSPLWEFRTMLTF